MVAPVFDSFPLQKGSLTQGGCPRSGSQRGVPHGVATGWGAHGVAPPTEAARAALRGRPSFRFIPRAKRFADAGWVPTEWHPLQRQRGRPSQETPRREWTLDPCFIELVGERSKFVEGFFGYAWATVAATKTNPISAACLLRAFSRCC